MNSLGVLCSSCTSYEDVFFLYLVCMLTFYMKLLVLKQQAEAGNGDARMTAYAARTTNKSVRLNILVRMDRSLEQLSSFEQLHNPVVLQKNFKLKETGAERRVFDVGQVRFFCYRARVLQRLNL